MIGETFGNYKIVRRLGSGAMGTVFLGEHERIARHAAIKVLAPEFATDAEILGRFFDEARATSVIHHPTIVEILDCGVHPDGQRPYIAMEYLRGETLAASLEREDRLPWPEACAIAAQMAEGLGAAHRHRIVHRDVKPANVMRTTEGSAAAEDAPFSRVKVLDFGVAKLLQDTQSGARTHPGKLLGTPEYMAPEQCGAEGTVDACTDIYALGCVLFEMVTGSPPFPAQSLNELIVAHRWREPPAASSLAEVPPALDALIAHLLAKRPTDRPPHMTSVVEALRALLERSAETARAPSPSAVAATTFIGRAASANAPARAAPAPSLELETAPAVPGRRARPAAPAMRPRTLALALGGTAVVAVVVAGALLRPRAGRPDRSPAPVTAAATPAPAGSTPAPAASPPAPVPAVGPATAPPPRAQPADTPERAAAERRARAPHHAHPQRSPDVDDGITNL